MFFLVIFMWNPKIYASSHKVWLDEFMETLDENKKTVLDFSYLVDQQDFPSIFNLPQVRMGRKNKAEVFDRFYGYYARSGNAKYFDFLDRFVPYLKSTKPFPMDGKQTALLQEMNNFVTPHFEKLVNSLKECDHCQIKPDLINYVPTMIPYFYPTYFVNYVTTIISYFHPTKFYLYSSLLSSDLNQNLPLRVKNIVFVLDSFHECKPNLLEVILGTTLRNEMLDLTRILLNKNKISKETAHIVSNTIGDKTLAKKKFAEAMEMEFWSFPYLTGTKSSLFLSELKKEYKKTFPKDPNKFFNEKKFLQQASRCYNELISGLESESFENISNFCSKKEIPSDNPEDCNLQNLNIMTRGIAKTGQDFLDEAKKLHSLP